MSGWFFMALEFSFWILFQQNNIMRPCSSSSISRAWVITIKNFTNFGKISIFCKIIIEPGILPQYIFPHHTICCFFLWHLGWLDVLLLIDLLDFSQSWDQLHHHHFLDFPLYPSHNYLQYLLLETHFHWCRHFMSSLYFHNT